MPKGNKVIDIGGRRFGRLVVLSFVGLVKHKARWACRCDCGVEKTIGGKELRNGDTQSCGCQKTERARLMGLQIKVRHGHAPDGHLSPTYRCWGSMIQRCTNPKHRGWKYYGGRGIGVCERWMKFDNFLADMGQHPNGLTIDRINNDGNYEPGNCRWADWMTQANNKRQRTKTKGNSKWR